MPPNLYRVDRTWYARIEKHGRTFRKSLETDKLATAQERLALFRKELIDTQWGEVPVRTFDDAARRFKEEHFPLLSPNAQKRYVCSLLKLADVFHGVRLDQIKSAKLGEYEKYRLAQGVTSATVRRDLACLSSIFSRAEEWEWANHNPVKPYLRGRKAYLPDAEPRKRYLTHDEENGICAFAPPVAVPAIRFAIDTGLRKAEQFGLVWRDINFEKNEIHVRAEIAKGGKERVVPMLPRVRAWLEAQPKGLPHLPVFRSRSGRPYSVAGPFMRRALQKGYERAGIKEHVRWHDLRRTCGCRLLQDWHLGFEEVAAWLGHSDVHTTQTHYAFLNVNQLHAAIARHARVVPFAPTDPSQKPSQQGVRPDIKSK
jgi:integrase